MSDQRAQRPNVLASLAKLDAHHRVEVSAVIGLAGYGLLSFGFREPFDMPMRLVLGWDAFALCLVALAWCRIVTAHPREALMTARLQHSTRKWIFLFVLVAAIASLAGVFFLLRDSKDNTARITDIALALSTVVLSWALVHTLFALEYAYLYYRRHTGEPPALLFPGGRKEPDYYDFAYFSFVIGMCSQVSDVAIASREVRRWALLHGLLTFAFNLMVLALAINLVSDKIKGKDPCPKCAPCPAAQICCPPNNAATGK